MLATLSGMQIYVNGERREVDDQCTAARLIEQLGLTGQRVAVEVNLEIVPRGACAAHALQPGDKIEIVRAIGGG